MLTQRERAAEATQPEGTRADMFMQAICGSRIPLDVDHLKARGYWEESFIRRVLTPDQIDNIFAAHWQIGPATVMLERGGIRFVLVDGDTVDYLQILRRLGAHDYIIPA